MRYGGSSSGLPGLVSCYHCIGSVTNTTLADSARYGLYAEGGYSFSHSGNSYSNMGQGNNFPSGL